jgi:hypothetical protein
MTTAHPPPDPTVRLADRLGAARHARFVGRVDELALFRSALRTPAPPFAVLHLHGPGGVGKSTLLGEFARIAAEHDLPVLALDGRSIDPSPAGFVRALGSALGLAADASPLEALAQRPAGVLLIDTYEALTPLDGWLRASFLPELPGETLVVIAGRTLPAAAWRTEPGWRDLVRIISLRNLRPEESRAYLRRQGVPDAQHTAALDVTHGHPLALSLIADVLAHSAPSAAVSLAREHDVVRVLVERFAQQAPSARHRRALDACAHLRVTTEDVLAAALAVTDEDAQALFAWLSGLSFVEQGPEGLFPHDLARDVLDLDQRWRNPDAYARLRRQVRAVFIRRLQGTRGAEQQRAFVDLLYLHRRHPLMRPFYDWQSLGASYADQATAADRPAILALVQRHEGAASARIAAHWLARQPQGCIVLRGLGGVVAGVIVHLALHEATAADRQEDPAVDAVLTFVERSGRVRPGEALLLSRFLVDREAYQAASPTYNAVAMTSTTRWVTTPRLAWSFVAVADPDLMQPNFTYINLRRTPGADFEVGGRRYGVFAHDWRAEPPLAWMEALGERELATELTAEAIEATASPPLVVLSRPDFQEAVRRALRDYPRPDALAANPLLRSRLVREAAEDNAGPRVLQTLLRDAAAALQANPRDEKLYRALQHTYLEPAGTQEAVAERLDLSFGTYRSHLAAGVERVTEWLWRRELDGAAG